MCDVAKRVVIREESALSDSHDNKMDEKMNILKEEIEEKVNERLETLEKEFNDFLKKEMGKGPKDLFGDKEGERGDPPEKEELEKRKKFEGEMKVEGEKSSPRKQSKGSPEGRATNKKNRSKRKENEKGGVEKLQLNFPKEENGKPKISDVSMVTGPSMALRKDWDKINEVIGEMRKLSEGEEGSPLTRHLKLKIMDLIGEMNEIMKKEFEREKVDMRKEDSERNVIKEVEEKGVNGKRKKRERVIVDEEKEKRKELKEKEKLMRNEKEFEKRMEKEKEKGVNERRERFKVKRFIWRVKKDVKDEMKETVVSTNIQKIERDKKIEELKSERMRKEVKWKGKWMR